MKRKSKRLYHLILTCVCVTVLLHCVMLQKQLFLSQPQPSHLMQENNHQLQQSSQPEWQMKEYPELFRNWSATKVTACGGKFHGYMNEFAELHDVMIDLNFCHGLKGGEDIAQVFNQSEKKEYYSFDKGCFKMMCKRPLYYRFHRDKKNHLTAIMASLQTQNVRETNAEETIHGGFNVLVTRYEYANLYHTMTDWYNAFLLMGFFNKTAHNMNIIFVDGHPKGALDSTWTRLFHSFQRFSDLKPITLFKDLYFNIMSYNSYMLDHSRVELPLADEFSDYFLSQHGLSQDKRLVCDNISISFLWRHDYLAPILGSQQ